MTGLSVGRVYRNLLGVERSRFWEREGLQRPDSTGARCLCGGVAPTTRKPCWPVLLSWSKVAHVTAPQYV